MVIPCLALGCAQEEGTSTDRATYDRTLETRDAARVLGFESTDLWTAQGRGVTAAVLPSEKQAALEVTIADRVWLSSAAFQCAKTPNIVELTIRAPERTTPNAHGGYAQAYLSCLSREVARESVGRVELGVLAPGESKRIALAVPPSVQRSLAGGCEQLQVDISIDVGSAPGTYALGQLKLRAQTPPIVRDATPLCGLPEIAELAPSAVELPEGYMDYQAWVTTATMREELPALEAALQPYEDSVLGPATDHVNQQIVVVVDPEEFRRGRVFEDLQSRDIALPLRIQPACNSVAEVRAARKYILEQGKSRKSPGFGGYTDPASGHFVVKLDPGTPPTSLEIESEQRAQSGLARLPADAIYEPAPANRNLFKHLKKRFGAAIDVEWGRPTRAGRLDDGQPHYGGAGIGEAGNNYCTSGFIAIKNGFRGAVTAGHCYAFGGPPESNLWVTSGPKTYGITGVAAAYPLYDLIRIDPGGQTFTNTIHTDPGQLTRVQLGKKDTVQGVDVVCVSGMLTRSKCSITIVRKDCVVGVGGDATANLTLGRRTGVTIVQQGDSGGPVYQPSGSTGAIINGIIIGKLAADQVCFHEVSTVETQLGVTVAL